MKVIVHFVHGGPREMYISDEKFENEVELIFNEMYQRSDWKTGYIQFKNALIPNREIKFIELKEPPKLPKNKQK